MGKKVMYRAKKVNAINWENLGVKLVGKRMIIGIDAAKISCNCVLMNEEGDVLERIKWNQLEESQILIEHIVKLPTKWMEAAMEPSGTYGDPLRYQLNKVGIPVYRVSPKKTYNYAEVYDGVPSTFDEKCAVLVGQLHLDGKSDLWTDRNEEERELAALIKTYEMYSEQKQRNQHRLEAILARHWPELTLILDLSRVTLYHLLEKYGGPRAVRSDPNGAADLMKLVGKSYLKGEKIDRVISSAKNTIGVLETDAECEAIKELARDTLRAFSGWKKFKRIIEDRVKNKQSIKNMGTVVGLVTAAVLVAEGDDPLKYKSPSQYLKQLGLNLKERSSGKHKGQLKITKRGSGKVRQLLYLSTLRLIRENKVVQAWHQKKIKRDGGVKIKSVIAIMRKLVKVLWHIARGSDFDISKMYDVSRLDMAAA